MKSKMKGVLGIALALVVLLSLLTFAIPVSADPYDPLTPKANTWTAAEPLPGFDGGWFYDPTITQVGPIAKDKNEGAADQAIYAWVGGIGDIAKSTNGGRTWAFSVSPASYKNIGGGAVVDMVCSPVSDSVIYVTDGNYVYKSINGGTTFAKVAASDLENNLSGACGTAITGGPITCLDVTYSGGEPIVFIGTKYNKIGAYEAAGSVYWIADEAFPASWHDLTLGCYDGCCDTATSYNGCYDVYAVGASPDFETSNKVYVAITRPTVLKFAAASTDVVTVTPESAATVITYSALTNVVYSGGVSPDTMAAGAETFTGPGGGNPAEEVVVSVVGESATFADDVGGTNTVTICPAKTEIVYTLGATCDWTSVAELLYNCVAGNNFESRHASHFAFPTDYTSTMTFFIGVAGTTGAGPVYGRGGDVYRIVDNVLATTQMLDLNVNPGLGGCTGYDSNICSLDIKGNTADASLIAGVLDETAIGLVIQSPVRVYYSYDGGWTWKPSTKDPTGADSSAEGWVYVLFFGNSAVAGTKGTNCGFSMSCESPVGAYWNQISLIDMDNTGVLDLSFGPTYATGVKTMFALLTTNGCRSLFRYDGTYWERVHFSHTFSVVASAWVDKTFDWVEQSPDFDTSHCVYMLSDTFEIVRSMNAGCSWLPLSYPCVAINVSAWIVSDENTVLVAGADPVNGTIFRTTSAGSQPWDEFVARNCDNALASDGIDFDLAAPMTDDSAVLFGDDNGQVFFSNNLGATWHEVRDVVTGKFDAGNGNTYVAFDPGYYDATDAGYHTFYAAASDDVGRCTLADPTAVSLCKSDWLSLVNDICCEDMTLAEASGIEAVGDTTLYVADAGSGLGVWRTVNPLDVVTEVPPLNLVEWSELDATLVAQNFEHPMDSDDLWVTQGSNDLWCLESDDANFIYMWSDPLAAQVALVSPTNGQLLTTTTTVTLQWAALDNATCYEVALYIACPECLSTFGMLPVDISDLGCKAAAVPCAMCSGANNAVVCGQTCLPVAGLTAGTKYYWKVRVACESPVVSKWSDLYYFNTALDVTDFLCSPRCGADGIILNTNFSWDVVLGATSYELQIVAASADGTADFTGATTLTSNVNALASIPGLQYSTVYFWRVRAVNDGVAGAWATCLFTTMDEPEACPEPITPVTIVTEEVTPVWIWVIIGIGGALTIVVIILIVTTRKAS